MKIAMVLLAAVALIGSAAAWDYYDSVYYERNKVAYEQAGDPLLDFVGAHSGAYFSGKDNVGQTVEGAIFNSLSGNYQNWPTAGSNYLKNLNGEPSQTISLFQTGTAYATTRPEGETDAKGNPLPVVDAGLTTKQNLHFEGARYTGNYNDAFGLGGKGPGVFAQFESEGNVGVDGKYVLTSFTDLERASGRAQPGMVETTDINTYFTSADIGMASTAGMKLFDLECGPIFSGTVTSFAGFDGGRGTGVIEANAGGFENHVMVLQGQGNKVPDIITSGFTPAEYWTTVQTNQKGFPYW